MPYLQIAVPKGHLWDNVISILDFAGYHPRLTGERSYSLETADPELTFRVHRAQNIGPLVEEGKYDLGITGLDWIRETSIEVTELLDLEFGKINVVSALPQAYYEKIRARGGNIFSSLISLLKKDGKSKIIIASEYENLTKELCSTKIPEFDYRFIRSYGATETFIDAADMIIDCSETGSTLRENGWEIVHTLFESTARLIANKESLLDSWKKVKINDLISLLKGAIDARRMKLLKMNISQKNLEKIIKILPSMKSPTISKLYGNSEGGYALEVAVNEKDVIKLIPKLKKEGATDILELDIKKVVK